MNDANAMPTEALMLVAMGVDAHGHAAQLDELGAAIGATVAYLQQGAPALVDELDRLADGGVSRIRLVRAPVGATTPARSWLRRVAAHWVRERPGTEVLVAGRAVTGREAPLQSPAWESVPAHRHHVLVCRGPRCTARGAAQTASALADTLAERGLGDDEVLVTQTGCLFPCNHAPVVVVHPDDTWYGQVDHERARQLVDDHLLAGTVLPGVLPREVAR
ncbi:(2Fe-2S) ferredoxin domain-containing protein [Aeromicrobium choanae]|uniref:(2Fe-2S) ferredoxin n=1 Tax=Aeromicrobium choanae TaxID=1736691 RepID=A0A1T4YTL1_9ACTN|nr:(2Fe-2S) ferredoxin domain-containing protein [Aeromicrobium choanae]SKB04601.1 (2Fe-2S) ferredoxin [Aeromicrobium choanae]